LAAILKILKTKTTTKTTTSDEQIA